MNMMKMPESDFNEMILEMTTEGLKRIIYDITEYLPMSPSVQITVALMLARNLVAKEVNRREK